MIIDQIFLLAILPGSALLICSIFFILLPPKKRNWIYGYRTYTAMRSQDTWHSANSYSGRLLLKFSAAAALIGGVAYAIFQSEIAIFFGGGSVFLGAFLSILLTEIYLRKNFDKEGRKKPV